MMSPVDASRIALENITALLSDAEEELRPAHLRIVCRMKTNEERQVANMIAAARVAIAAARVGLATWHPDGRK